MCCDRDKCAVYKCGAAQCYNSSTDISINCIHLQKNSFDRDHYCYCYCGCMRIAYECDKFVFFLLNDEEKDKREEKKAAAKSKYPAMSGCSVKQFKISSSTIKQNESI